MITLTLTLSYSYLWVIGFILLWIYAGILIYSHHINELHSSDMGIIPTVLVCLATVLLWPLYPFINRKWF